MLAVPERLSVPGNCLYLVSRTQFISANWDLLHYTFRTLSSLFSFSLPSSATRVTLNAPVVIWQKGREGSTKVCKDGKRANKSVCARDGHDLDSPFLVKTLAKEHYTQTRWQMLTMLRESQRVLGLALWPTDANTFSPSETGQTIIILERWAKVINGETDWPTISSWPSHPSYPLDDRRAYAPLRTSTMFHTFNVQTFSLHITKWDMQTRSNKCNRQIAKLHCFQITKLTGQLYINGTK